MSEEHSERSEGIIKVAVLVVGAVLLIGTGYIAGRATAPKVAAGEAREGAVTRVASAAKEVTGKGGGEAAGKSGGEAAAKGDAGDAGAGAGGAAAGGSGAATG